MTEKNWKQVFYELCKSQKTNDDWETYLLSLHNKEKKVLILIGKEQEVWHNLASISSESPQETISAENNQESIAIQILMSNSEKKEWKNKFLNIKLEAETYIESALQNMNSMADILSQLINLVVLEGVLDIKEVSIHRVTQEVEKKILDLTNKGQDTIVLNGLKNSLNNLSDSESFKYIRAFVNVIKHRQLIATDFSFAYSTGEGSKEGIRFLSFSYSYSLKGAIIKENYEVTWSKTITDIYVQEIFRLLDEIGESLNQYLLSISR